MGTVMVLLLKPSPKEVWTLIKTEILFNLVDSVLQEKLGKVVVSGFSPDLARWHVFGIFPG